MPARKSRCTSAPGPRPAPTQGQPRSRTRSGWTDGAGFSYAHGNARTLRLRSRDERDLRVVHEKIAPEKPVVTTRDLAIRRVEPVLLHELGQRHRSFARHVGGARAEPIELHATGLDCLELLLKRIIDSLRTGAEDADVRERARVVVRRGERMSAAHREPRDRTIVFRGEHAETLFDKRNHVLHQTTGVRTGVRLWRAAPPARSARPSGSRLFRLNRRRRRRLE